MWSPQQEKALSAVSRWLANPEGKQVFRLFGFAGTGKTTLAKHLVEQVDGEVYFAAYTGKAAHVLASKGCAGAMTIHRLIYMPKERSRVELMSLQRRLKEIVDAKSSPDAPATDEEVAVRQKIRAEEDNHKQPSFVVNEESILRDERTKLVVIDECSMVDQRIGEDLESFGVPILVLGDPAQLPPVRGSGYFTSQEPDVMLTEIHRQALDNPIIRLADMVRRGERLDVGSYGDSLVRSGRPDPQDVMAADQVLVGRNKTRRASNLRIRDLLGYSGELLVPGERLVCLRNNHKQGLLNGTLWNLVDVVGEFDDTVVMTVRNEFGAEVEAVGAHKHYFEGRGDELGYWEKRDAEEFDYGYAMTCHKSQGSQWDHVFVFDESNVFRQDASKWLYTAITRASERVTVCRA